MTGHHRLSEERRLEVVFKHKSGKSIRDIAKKLGINKNTVSNIVKKHKSTGSVKDLPGRGRKKSTTQRQDSRLIRRSLNDRRLTSSDLKKVWQEECGINVTRTVRSRLNEAGLKGCVAVKKPLLSKKNRKARFDWARAHKACMGNLRPAGQIRPANKFSRAVGLCNISIFIYIMCCSRLPNLAQKIQACTVR